MAGTLFKGRHGGTARERLQTLDNEDELRRMRAQLGGAVGEAALMLFSQIAMQKFTTAGVAAYKPTSGMKFVLGAITGGGGGGGGADTDGVAGSVAAAGGGGSGGTRIFLLTRAQVDAALGADGAIAVTIGAGGTAGAITGGTGGVGGASTFGSLFIGGGGGGGSGTGTVVGNTSTDNYGGGAGSATAPGGVGISLGIIGGYGGDGAGASVTGGGTSASIATGGYGAAAFWGGGGGQLNSTGPNLATDRNDPGYDGTAPGSGGSGAICFNSTTGAIGGLGAAGICILLEFA